VIGVGKGGELHGATKAPGGNLDALDTTSRQMMVVMETPDGSRPRDDAAGGGGDGRSGSKLRAHGGMRGAGVSGVIRQWRRSRRQSDCAGVVGDIVAIVGRLRLQMLWPGCCCGSAGRV